MHVPAGSIIPMGPFRQYVDDKKDAPIEIRIYKGEDAQFVLYEDDGKSYKYEKGNYSTIPFIWKDNTNKLIIGDREGSFQGMSEQKTFKIVFVQENNGVGLDIAENPDSVIKYKGARREIN